MTHGMSGGAEQQAAAAGMLCPACKVDLVMSERQGVEIDYCPRCRGVWLDRGELDKIIERAAAELAPPAQPQPPKAQPQSPLQPLQSEYRRDDDRDDRYRQNEYGYQKHHKHRRKSFLEDLFD
jgi:Zn-finger nucleic acid-binding protein